MAYNYDAAKKAWESMNDQQKKQYTEQNKNDANFQQFAQQYHNENYSTGNSNSNVNQWQWTITPQSNTNGSNFNNDNGSNWGFSSNNGWNNNYNFNNSPLSDWKNWNWNFYGSTQFDQEEQLDKSMFQQGTWVKVEQGTAKDTWRPDYQLDSDARLAEMTNNLNTYWQTNPEYFSNRETFNKVFEYNQRESDAQRALLDSYWKKKKDMDTASNYNSWDSIYWGLNNAEITPDVFSLIKQMNPEAYQQYQKMLKDEQDKAIANLKFTGAEPLDVTLTNIINKLGIQPWDPHKIRQTFEDRLTELNVWQDSEQLRVLGNNIAGLMSAMNNNAQSLSSQLEWRYSAGYIDARINKANANLQRQANTMLTSYSTLLQWRQQNIALAYQSAQVEQMQANEDERIFQQKIQWLNFAMQYNSYRTPEQQAALRLEEDQIKNNMELLQKSQENDLALYNQYATAKLNNQIEAELTDLDVSDPAQQRANLNRVVWQYFEKYWDIIQRSQAQVVSDVLAQAKAEWISVAEALKKNFIEPLQSKPEYQQAVKDAYNLNSKTEFVKTDNWWWVLTINPDWTFSFEYIYWNGWSYWTWWSAGWMWSNWVYNFSESEVRTWDTIWNDINSIWHILQSDDWIRIWTYKSKNWYTYNVYANREDWIRATEQLLKKWYYWKTLADAAQKWIWQWKDITAAKNVIKQAWLSLDAKLDDTNVRKFIEAMWTWEWTLKWQSLDEWAKWGKDLSWYALSKEQSWVNANPYNWVSWYTSNGKEINAGWWITSLEKYYTQDKWRSDKEMESTLNWYGIDISQFNEQQKKYAEYMMSTELQSTLKDSLERIDALIKWENEENSWVWDYHQWTWDRLSVTTDADGNLKDSWLNPFGIITDAAAGKSLFDYLKNNETLNKYLNLKQAGATFWSMQQAEWDMIASSVSELKWEQNKETFQANLQKVRARLESQLMELDPTYNPMWWIDIEATVEKYFKWWQAQTWAGEVAWYTWDLINFVYWW